MRVVFLFLFICINQPSRAQELKFSYTFPSMGSEAKMIFFASDSATAQSCARRVRYLLDSIESCLSDYRPDSEISRLNDLETVHFQSVSPLLYDILMCAKEGYDLSGGAFDCTIGTITQMWRGAKKSKVMPSREAIRSATLRSGFNHIVLSPDAAAIRYKIPGIRFDFGGIAKGYAAQKTIELLQEAGVTAALMDMGGDIAVSHPPPDMKGWEIAINLPESHEALLPATMLLSGMAVATSGKLYNYIEWGQKKYSHIIHPRTGMPLLHNRQVTIIAPDGATADWLATACSVLKPGRAKRLARRTGAGLLMLEHRNGKIRHWQNRQIMRFIS